LILTALSLAAVEARVAVADAPGLAPVEGDVFVAGQDGYHTFRIPSLLATPRGTLLAFCEGRKQGRGDSGDIDLVMRSSSDSGATWGPLVVVAEDGANTVGNPCPVVDRATGTIWLALTRNLGGDSQRAILAGTSRGTRSAWLSRSTDDGRTWSQLVDITARVKAPDWTWYATGPGVGIQLRSGRLVVPCDHYLAGSRAAGAHVIYSDDHGATWSRSAALAGGVNECQVAELADGTLVLNMRNQPPRGSEGRAIATSSDGGQTWSQPWRDAALIEPACQASLIGFSDESTPGRVSLLFSNPAGTTRAALTVRRSDDGGKTWPRSCLLHGGPSAYSCLMILPDGRVGCLYERGAMNPYERITLARFSLSWLAPHGDRARP
jgi:sialidase-1